MSGPVHGKVVLIPSGYLLRKYGQAGPLGLSASLVFEQSYGMGGGGIARPSPNSGLGSRLPPARLCAKDIAVTGSVNQHGQVEAVGSATQKIEGFFDLCRTRGLTGSQGVSILGQSCGPTAAVRNDHLRSPDGSGSRNMKPSGIRSATFDPQEMHCTAEALVFLTRSPVGSPDTSSLHKRWGSVAGRYRQTLEIVPDQRGVFAFENLDPLPSLGRAAHPV